MYNIPQTFNIQHTTNFIHGGAEYQCIHESYIQNWTFQLVVNYEATIDMWINLAC